MIQKYLRVVGILVVFMLSACSSLQPRPIFKDLESLDIYTQEVLNGIYVLKDTDDSMVAEDYQTLWRSVTDGSAKKLPVPDALGISVLSTNELQLILFKQKKVLDTYVLDGKISHGKFSSKTDRDFKHQGNAMFIYSTDKFYLTPLPEDEVVIKHHHTFAYLIFGLIPIGNNDDGKKFQLKRISSLQ